MEDLHRELTEQIHYSVFFYRESINYGYEISSTTREHARACKIAVAVVSEEYFTRKLAPMKELAASHTAAKERNGTVPHLLPVFFALDSDDAKNYEIQEGWFKKWDEWETNEDERKT